MHRLISVALAFSFSLILGLRTLYEPVPRNQVPNIIDTTSASNSLENYLRSRWFMKQRSNQTPPKRELWWVFLFVIPKYLGLPDIEDIVKPNQQNSYFITKSTSLRHVLNRYSWLKDSRARRVLLSLNDRQSFVLLSALGGVLAYLVVHLVVKLIAKVNFEKTEKIEIAQNDNERNGNGAEFKTNRNPQLMIKPVKNFAGYTIDSTLSHGVFGKVYLAKDKSDSKVCIIKEVSKNAMINVFNEKAPYDWNEKVKCYSIATECNFCIRVISFMENKNFLYMVTEYGGVDLNTYRTSIGGRLGEDAFVLILAQLCCALDFLHLRGIIHRYVTPENVYITRSANTTLGNLSRAIQRTRPTHKARWGYIGAYPYTAPEIPRDHPYDQSIDWWNVGVLMFQCLYGQLPFVNGNETTEKVQRRILREEVIIPDIKRSPSAVIMIRQFLSKNPNERLGSPFSSWGSIFNQKFFKCHRLHFFEDEAGYVLIDPKSLPADMIQGLRYFRGPRGDVIHEARPLTPC